ncbi:hypothetical protein M2475_001597 [Breznakia sp. PF5-3]|uniref:hypothetical protein n=1 Tax=unclassified Breznakia TaxID=2623764 RepID=UPI002404E73B|nr:MULTISPECIES: hypothetical protein [unclassified Breznakia]MDF9825538.1 hypothetical protein [Breznakia sp. PM6-1]MDF9836021.1 hypothetical protein [Breznakia sp. PF5-3]MDF9837551.1 hypothetical protein [Breznakia sp. PFB2-8]MDF9860557.1 hypothetical protein [Breznakia sp. PH5-24]
MENSKKVMIEQMEIYLIRAKWSRKRHIDVYQKAHSEARKRTNIRILIMIITLSSLPVIYFNDNLMIRICMVLGFILGMVTLYLLPKKEKEIFCETLKGCANEFKELENEIMLFTKEIHERDYHTITDVEKRNNIIKEYLRISEKSPIIVKKENQEDLKKLPEKRRNVLSTTHEFSVIEM